MALGTALRPHRPRDDGREPGAQRRPSRASRSRSITARRSRMETVHRGARQEGPLDRLRPIEEWARFAARPRVLMSMVQAGAATDAVIDEILPYLDAGDMLIDGGNANFRDTQRRHDVRGGAWRPLPRSRRVGRRRGCAERAEHHARRRSRALRRSRSSRSSRRSRPRSTAPRAAPTSGPDGAGHYVKMVHNGIEYADMQLIAESYDLLRNGVGLEVPADRRAVRTLERSGSWSRT